MNYLYWIHYPHHTDPYTEGYIGITNDLYMREYKHRNGGGSPIAYNAMKKGACFSVLHQYNNRNDVVKKEIEYRPTENIGWNIREGGGDPPRMTPELANRPDRRRAVSEGKKKQWSKWKEQGFKHRTMPCQHCQKEIGATMHKRHENSCLSNPEVYNRLPECAYSMCNNKVINRPDRQRYCSKECSAKDRHAP